MSLAQFGGACVAQFWFWAGMLTAFILGRNIGQNYAGRQAADRIRDLEERIGEVEEKNKALRDKYGEYDEEDEYEVG